MNTIFREYPLLLSLEKELSRAVDAVVEAYRGGNKLLLCGNGGSAADCEHMSGELIKEFKLRRPIDPEAKERLFAAGAGEMAERLAGGICAIPLPSLTSVFSALCNDVGYEYAFAQEVYAMGRADDVLFAFSTSGSSASVVNAAIAAKAKGMRVISFTGMRGGKLQPLSDICLAVPAAETFRVQELHLPLYHEICARAEEILWGKRP